METSVTGDRPETAPAAPPEADVEYLFGPFRMDVASLQLWKGDQLVPLTPKAIDTLIVLIQHRNRLVRKEELLSAVWPNSFVSEDSLAQNITALRRSLGDDHNQPQYIATIPRRGYRFVALVTTQPAADIPENPRHRPAADVPPPAPVAAAVAAETATATVAAERPGVTAAPGRRTLYVSLALGAVAIAAVGFWAGHRQIGATVSDSSLNFTLIAPPTTRLASGGVLSPDGKSIAFVAQDEATGALRIWVRALDSGVARTLEGSEGASRPFWSPDGQGIGFFANGRLKRIGLSGGSAQTLASYVGLSSSGGSWNRGDMLLFASYKTGLWAVPASGGKPTEVTTLNADTMESAHRWPQFLPDDRHFLFSVVAEKPGFSGVYVGSLDSKDRVKLLDENAAVYATPGYLLFIRDQVLLAQPFDVNSLRLSGQPVPIASDVPAPNTNNNAAVSAVENLLTFGSTSGMKLAWFDRAGTLTQEVKAPTGLSNPTLSTDQAHVVAGSGSDVWLIDLERDAPTRIVPGNTPLQSPDGSHIAFTSARETGVSDIYVRPTTGPGHDELVVRSAENKFVTDWSRDGRYLVYGTLNQQTKMDLWVLPREQGGKPAPFLTTPFNEFQAQISPDGRWIAYSSDESGTWEVYVQSFPTPGAKRAISAGGGSEPQWRSDGKELFYLAADGTLTGVDIDTAGELRAGRRRPLFRSPIPISGEMYMRRNHYVPSADGRRFLMNTPLNAQGSITVLVNWRARVDRR